MEDFLRLMGDEELRTLRHGYLDNSALFCSLYPGLAYLERLYGELSPAQIWHEMEVFCAHRLVGVRALEYEVIDLWNALQKRYSAFCRPDGSMTKRSYRQAEFTAVCVLTCVCFRLVAEPDRLETSNSRKAEMEILKLIGTHPVHAHLYKAQRAREEVLEKEVGLIGREAYVSVDPQSGGKRLVSLPLDKSGRAGLFRVLYRTISLEEWEQLVAHCEEQMIFKHKIDRIAYLVVANHRNWLKAAKTMQIAQWVKLMNDLLGPTKEMQQSEVSRKWNEMKDEGFYESAFKLRETSGFHSKHISESFFRTLKEHVNQINQYTSSLNERRE